MAYTPTLADIPQTGTYTPTLADIEEIDNGNNPAKPSLTQTIGNGLKSYYQGEYNLGAGAAHALNNLGQSVYQQGVDKPIDLLFGSNLTAKDKAAQQANNQAFDQKYGNSMAAKVGGIAGTIAPFAIAPEALGIDLASAPAATEGILANYPRLTSLAGIAGKNAAYGAAANQITGGNPVEGAAIGGAGGLAGEAINAGVKAIRPSNLLAGGASPEELAQNLAATRGTNTPLGDVINSPMLKRLNDNILTKIPFSGANSKLQQTGQQVVNQGNDIMSQLLGNNTAGDVGATLQQSLKDKLSTLQQMKRDNYATPNNIADQLGLTVGRTNFSQVAQDTLDKIKKSPELAREVQPSILDDLKAYADPEVSNSLELSNIFKGKIGDKASDYFTNNQNYEYGIYRNLKGALDNDITDAIKSSGSDELQNAHQEANKFYKENIAPFEDPNIVKFTKQGGDADTLLSNFIKPGMTNDRGNLINTLVSKLPTKQQTLPAYGWFSKALDGNGNVDPLKFSRLYRNLGTKQKNALIPDANLRQQMDSYANLIGKNGKALSVMQNPPTGQQIADYLPMVTGMAGYTAGGLAGGIAGLGLSAAISNPIVRALTNPNVRENLVQKMIAGGNYSPVVGNKILGGIAGIPAQINNS